MANKDTEIVLLEEFVNLADAHIAKGVLETNGVPCIIDNEIMSSVYPLTITPLGAIRLMVRRCDVETARRILSSPAIDENQSSE